MHSLQQSAESVIAPQTGVIFIVDDEIMVTASLKTMLELETGHHIHTFNDPREALAAVTELRPDVVISDFSMPGMDGIVFLRNVKNILPEATLILLTGYADKESAIEAINSVGIYRYIEKPWDNAELKISIQNSLERAHLISNLQRSVQDLTEAREALERSNQHLEALVEERTRDLQTTYLKLQSIVHNTADGIMTLNAALEATSINPAVLRWLEEGGNPRASDWRHCPVERLLRLPTSAGKHDRLRQVFQSPESRRVLEVAIGDLPLEAGIAPLPDPEGKEGGFVVVLRDITQRKEIERLRDDFVSTLTHDLRTPLLAAIQTLGFFVDGSLGELTERQHELIQMLIQSNRELLGLVNVLLEVYKYESGRQKLIVDTVSLPDLVRDVVQELGALASHREQSLSVAFTENAGPEQCKVRGDKQELKRVLVNLIGNAIHFTPKEGDIQVFLALTRRNRKPMVQVCVSDNGRGIPAQDIPQLFQRFSQGTSRQRSSGSGLGLYLSRQIVEAHNGHIYVESEESVGSRFYVELPALAVC